MANPQQHKDNLVRTTMRLLRRQGYASTGLQQILAESGAPKGSLYHYFPAGKESLAEAAVDLAGKLVSETLEDLAARHRDAATFVAAYCRTMAGWMEESEFRSGCPIATTMLEAAPQSPALSAAGRRAIDAWIEIVARVFARDGVGAAGATARAEALIAAMEGALVLARIRSSTRPILAVADLFAAAPQP